MSKKPETLFSNQLIKNLNNVFWTRIENKHGGGVPDLYGTYNNKSAFLELKIKTKQNKVIIWLVIQDTRSLNYTTETKGGNSWKRTAEPFQRYPLTVIIGTF